MIYIGRMPGTHKCDLCPVKLPDAITGIQFGPAAEGRNVHLCPSCLITLEKLIKEERNRARDMTLHGARQR